MQPTRRGKLGAQVEPYRILGACQPALAHEALTADPIVGVPLLDVEGRLERAVDSV